jgi:ribokinase
MIAVVGSLNMDAIARVAHLPAPGETVLASGFVQALGGKGANQAVAAARAGSAVEFVGRVGVDLAGEALVTSLRSAGVNTRHVVRDVGGSTGTALIAVDSQGQNSIVVVPGVNANLHVEDIDAARDVIERSSIVLLQLEIPLETVQYAAEMAHRSGTTVLLNPSPAQELPASLLNLVDILVPNEEEVAYLSGMGSPVDPASAAGMLRTNGAESVVVTLGDRGAAVIDENGETDIYAYDVEAVDTTGAGDAFVGNLAAALDAGQSLEEAARMASAAAALSVQAAGAQASMPSREQTNAFMAAMGTR